MKPGNTVVLTAKTHKGKNKIKNHGNKWIIRRFQERVMCLNNKPGILLQHIANPNHLRWIEKSNDPDFSISAG
jgi:hypothetical protein